jgi:hypothetical protein
MMITFVIVIENTMVSQKVGGLLEKNAFIINIQKRN